MKSQCSLCCDACPSPAGGGVDSLPGPFLFTVTISSNGYFLPGDDLELTVMHKSPKSQPRFSITLFNSHNSRVTPEVLQNETPQKYALKVKQLQPTDSGTWICNMHSDSPSINENISFNVKVLGM